ncbi:hypothetical protein NE237_031189 [Protea cynaroides]|uniref:F-box domain-containing protein n=1 Tax=Protea cynaroides TaxID=273540 RepID=A0A9Q0R294_9MAGN|nr:hypothetical protein NE237_031189 [Protea cynaroides]
METMESQKNNKETCDTISHLPEPILCYILSFLSTKDALRTSFLSKNFDESIFYGEPRSGKDDNKIWERKKRFVDLIDRSLLLHEGQNIRELKINFHHLNDSVLMTRANPWVCFALTNVFVLHLDFSSEPNFHCDPDEDYPENMYHLPPCYFPSKLLKTVILTQVELLDTLVQDLIANCPHLESIHLKWCWVLSKLIIIDAPQSQFKYFRLESNVLQEYHINIPSLLHIQFAGLEIQEGCLDNGYCNMLCELLNVMDHARALTLTNYSLMVFPLLEEGLEGLRECLPSPLYNLKHLTVQTDLNNCALVGLACLLRSSPNLEAFSLDFDYHDTGFLLLFPCLSHLEKVKINGFGGRKCKMGLVKYLLQKSFLLKEMVIIYEKYFNHEFLEVKLESFQKLIVFPKACEIKFS